MEQIIKQCTICLYKSNHPLGLILDNQGVCSGCKVHEEKDLLDWGVRLKALKKITDSYKLKNSNNYDCIVPVTGGQDSFFITHIVIHELGLNPLLLNFNRNFNSAAGIRNLSHLRSIFPADFRQFTINPMIARKVVRTTLTNLGTLNWLWIAGQTSLPVRIASELKVPLIIWGGHQGVEQVGMFSHVDEVEMTSRYRREHDLVGVNEEEIFKFDPDFTPNDISSLSYPSDDEILKNETRGIYLSNYIRWDPVEQHNFMRSKYGYIGRKTNRTYYDFDNPDCPVYNGLQDYLKFKRLGYGKVTDHLVRDIRHKRIDKKSAEKIESEYSKKAPEGLNNFARWLGIPLSNLESLVLSLGRDFSDLILSEGWKTELSNLHKSSFTFDNSGYDFIDEDFINFGKGI
jgi:N-acetyl sugar amidotransferase